MDRLAHCIFTCFPGRETQDLLFGFYCSILFFVMLFKIEEGEEDSVGMPKYCALFQSILQTSLLLFFQWWITNSPTNPPESPAVELPEHTPGKPFGYYRRQHHVRNYCLWRQTLQ